MDNIIYSLSIFSFFLSNNYRIKTENLKYVVEHNCLYDLVFIDNFCENLSWRMKYSPKPFKVSF